MSTETRSRILFVCVHNAGRSQMAAGFARTLDLSAAREHLAYRPAPTSLDGAESW